MQNIQKQQQNANRSTIIIAEDPDEEEDVLAFARSKSS